MDKSIKIFIIIAMSLLIGGFIGWRLRGIDATIKEERLGRIIQWEINNPDVIKEIIKRIDGGKYR